jgi:hypothetical protein
MGINQQGSAFSSAAMGATGAETMRRSALMDIEAPSGPQTPQQTPPELHNADTVHARADWETGFNLAGNMIAERDEQRGIRRLEGVSVVIIELDTTSQEAWPTDFSIDEVRNSIHIACDHQGLSTEDMRVTHGARRASFAARLRTDTCKALAEGIYLDLYPGPDRGDVEVEFRVHATDERGNKIVEDHATGPNDGQNRPKINVEADRRQDAEQRKKLMMTIHYNYPKDLLLAADDSPIFDAIKQDIKDRVKLAFGSDPKSQPQHINLLEAKTGEGESAHGLSLYIVNNQSFASKTLAELHQTVDLSLLKYTDSHNGSLVTGRMPTRNLKALEAKACCLRHDQMEVCTDPPANSCPSDGGACQLRKQTNIDIHSTLRTGSSTHLGQSGERYSVQKKRRREETQDGRKQAAAVHRSAIQISTCKAWEGGKCRSVSFIAGARTCRKAHPDEFTATAKIECCSSVARPNPERCLFTPALCPYRPGTHRDSW